MENYKQIGGLLLLLVILLGASYFLYTSTSSKKISNTQRVQPGQNTLNNSGKPHEITHAQKCDICKQLIKSGAKTSCVELLKCSK